jgi:hypothetical protein
MSTASGGTGEKDADAKPRKSRNVSPVNGCSLHVCHCIFSPRKPRLVFQSDYQKAVFALFSIQNPQSLSLPALWHGLCEAVTSDLTTLLPDHEKHTCSQVADSIRRHGRSRDRALILPPR